MLVKYTRFEESEHFKTALKQDVFLALRIFPKVDVLLREMLGTLEKKEIDPSVTAKINQLALVEVEKMMNILLMLKSNLEHFEEKPDQDKQLLNEGDEVEDAQTKLTDLIGQIGKLGGHSNLED